MKNVVWAEIFRYAGRVVAFLCAAAGVSVALICCAFAACTGISGYPSLFGNGIMLNDAKYCDVLPDNDLVFFSECAAEDFAAGDFVVYMSAGGIRTGRVYSVSASHLTVRTSDGSVVAFPTSSALGKATSHSPKLGRAISYAADNARAGFAGGITVAVTAVFLVLTESRRHAEEEPCNRLHASECKTKG